MADVESIDRRIIAALKREGRHSYASLAKELHIHAATIARRVEKMLVGEVIDIKAVLNPFKLGYNAHAFIALDIDLTKVDRVAARLVNNHNISLVVTTFGRYAMLLLADFPTWEMLQDYITRELPRIEGINKADAFPVIENKKLYNPLFKNDGTGGPASIDETDKTIIEELEKNGRASYAELAAKLGVSLATVSRRVARLQAENIIRISAIRNPVRLGYLANAYIVLRADLSKVDAICAALAVHHEVHMIMTLMSGFEILAGIHLQNPERLYRFIVKEIAGIDGVTGNETFICAEIRKRSYPLFDFDGE
jgi:Lrp/AsnC family transcriptional regulator for asnA, asnC and gidA